MKLLSDSANPTGKDDVARLAGVIDALRPARPHDAAAAVQAICALCYRLSRKPVLRVELRTSLLALLNEREQISLYTSTGILPNTGFFSEAARRISHKLLPAAHDAFRLKDLLSQFFHRPGDECWVNAVPDSCWIELLQALRFDEVPRSTELPPAIAQITRSVRILSFHIAAIGLEPELLRLEPEIEQGISPFLAQHQATLDWLERYESAWAGQDADGNEDAQVVGLLNQGTLLIRRIHHRATHEGTSIRLTYLLQRLQQHLERNAALYACLVSLRQQHTGHGSNHHPEVSLFKVLVQGECRKNDLRHHWNQSLGLLALRVTENASRAGEHYIAENRAEYAQMWRSALGAGVIIALMALLKLNIGEQVLPPLSQALLICLNYGFGFMIIHVLRFTVATKQPAMTAATLAASLGENNGQAPDLDGLTTMIARTTRSQFAAILGNVLMAVPISAAIGFAVQHFGNSPVISMDTARHLVDGIHPLHSAAIAYAAIAGACLFLSGLIAGYYDNLCAYNNIPQRLMQLGWLRRLLGQRRQQRLVRYVENNLGALAGNFWFGCMLGGVTALGTLSGLPLDIRHIAFSSAYAGYSLAAFNFHADWNIVAWTAAGITAIGLTNLAVSFALALTVALRARQIAFAQWRLLAVSVLRRLVTHPREFFLPPVPTGPKH